MQSNSPSPERSHHCTPEIKTAVHAQLELLPKRLGFTETDQLRELRAEMTAARANGDTQAAQTFATAYQMLGEQLIDLCPSGDDARQKAQHGMNIAMAISRRDGGQVDDFLADIDDALDYAEYLDYDDIATVLAAVISEGDA